MQRMIFVNIPTRDLATADRFYGALGFDKNPMFSDEQASCWMISDAIFVMVLDEEFYATFLRDNDTPNLRSDRIGTLHALSLESVAELESMFEKAIEGGGSLYRPAHEPFPGMVEGAVKDPDGHVWEFTWMDPQMATDGPPDM